MNVTLDSDLMEPVRGLAPEQETGVERSQNAVSLLEQVMTIIKDKPFY